LLAVKSIKKQNLVEIKNLNNPPQGVKLTLESICLLLGEETNDWKSIRSIIMRDNFISTIVNFNTDDIRYESNESEFTCYRLHACLSVLSSSIAHKMKTKYMNNPDYSYDKVNRASAACGPLVKWAIAQLTYADMLGKVEPLRNELKSLEQEAEKKVADMQQTNDLILSLETSIAQYKTEYADLISAAQAIKTDLSQVESKVERSIALIKNLSLEKTRWEMTSESYQTQLSTLIGDGFLISTFLAYTGYFDQMTRQILFQQWQQHLNQAHIPFKQDLARVEVGHWPFVFVRHCSSCYSVCFQC
jgi:dynein heavy chain 1, cytosolic